MRCLKPCRLTGATLVAKLDRLSRNAAFLLTEQADADGGVAIVRDKQRGNHERDTRGATHAIASIGRKLPSEFPQ